VHELVLDGAVLVECPPRGLRQQLAQHAVHGVRGERA
jgi:hypothetical protein